MYQCCQYYPNIYYLFLLLLILFFYFVFVFLNFILWSQICNYAAFKDPYSFKSVRNGQTLRVYENLLPENYFRIQYQLPCFKNQVPETFKIDVVIFGGVISKVYTENCSQVIECWTKAGEETEEIGAVPNIFGWKHKYVEIVSRQEGT